MNLNWIYIKTKKGKVTFCACSGDKLVREFDDMNMAYHYEKDFNHKFKVSIDVFLEDQKIVVQGKIDQKPVTSKIQFTDSTAFRALQNKIEKSENSKKSSNLAQI